MDCPECSQPCGTSDKFCSQCGCKLHPESKLVLTDSGSQTEEEQSCRAVGSSQLDTENVLATEEKNHTLDEKLPALQMKEFPSENEVYRKKAMGANEGLSPPPPQKLKAEDVRSDSVTLRWEKPADMEDVPYQYLITYNCDGEQPKTVVKESSTNIAILQDLKPGKEYIFNITTELQLGSKSKNTSIHVKTRVSPPRDLRVQRVTPNSVTLSWDFSDKMEGVAERYMVTWNFKKKSNCEVTERSVTVKNLSPGREYLFSVATIGTKGSESESVLLPVYTEPSPPVRLKARNISSNSVTLCWEKPANMEDVLYQYVITYHCDGEQPKTVIKESDTKTAILQDLKPGKEYTFNITAALEMGSKSKKTSVNVRTRVSPPRDLRVQRVTPKSVTLSWELSDKMEGVAERYMVTWNFKKKKSNCEVTERSVTVKNLTPGREYLFSVVTIGTKGSESESVSLPVYTDPCPPPPRMLKAEDVSSNSVTLCWECPAKLEDVPHQYIITYHCDGEQPQTVIKESDTKTAILQDLKPGKKYTFNITAALEMGSKSKEISIHEQTKTTLEELIYNLGLQSHLKNKLTLISVLEISSIREGSLESVKCLPWYFLRKLMMANVTARSGTTRQSSAFQSMDSLLMSLNEVQDSGNEVNPLDVIAALFLCSDGFLQQEMALKMSMCQFSVPLLLPNCDTQQSTLMLWALRDIVKKFRPHSLGDSRGFMEDSIALMQLPMISFVRLGNCSLSKSHILNQVLSNPQQYHDTFMHRNMVSGDALRRISDGLVEISWYLPCGNQNIDIFSEPVAIANMRGDISSFQTNFFFLCHTSAAVFVFCDDFRSGCELLDYPHMKSRLFLVCNSQHRNFNVENFKIQVSKLQLQPKNIIMKRSQMNDAEFVNNLGMTVSELLKENSLKMSIEDMSAVAHELGILVDENSASCQNGKKMAAAITADIHDIPLFKQKELPSQGEIWKELTKLEKEECRLKKAGDKNIEVYKSELSEQKRRLREQQQACDVSDTMSCFISAISNTNEERQYFLKWMRINLDNLSRRRLSYLREEYKKCVICPENQKIISDLSKQISSSSLGIEHFLREMGQLYESASSLPKNRPARQQMQNLPRLCAELLLDGFPLELVDGDASNIPINWLTAVMKELHLLTGSGNKIRVVTVLGVQSTGKSTLLNTMFGVQFAVSSGRCTRGAFMLLIKVKKDLKKQLKCDYIMLIDTEGLKSPELAELADSYEHDNELATLVVGLSDVTVINIAMENSTEMKDTLQIVVHAFLRMKEVGKKPCCQFVHQNVPDVSAHDKNVRDRKLLLEQLNDMTQIAAKMEKRGHSKKFTDIMDYDPEKNNWYIPGLWHGNPPMAPVNTGYSESVNEFKTSLINSLKQCTTPAHTFLEFLEWAKSLWRAVKYENFIFSFRNSLVADAYSRLCVEFNKLDWAFRKHMYTWLTQAETKLSNFATTASTIQSEDLLTSLKNEATSELDKQEKILLTQIAEYYSREETHIYLVEKYKEDFVNTAKTIRRETENSVKNKLEADMEIRKGMLRLNNIKKQHTEKIEQEVLRLIERCRKNKSKTTESKLDMEFGKMWNETVKELSFPPLQQRDIGQDIYGQLRTNLGREGSSVYELICNAHNLHECGREPFKVPSETDNVFKKLWIKVFGGDQKRATQQMADGIILQSEQFVAEKVEIKSDYHEMYMLDLLKLIDDHLQKKRDLETAAYFQACLKIHICGHAVREFQKMHDNFIHANDPRVSLEQYKGQYCTDFKDLFHERDQCERKAKEFTDLCLVPASQKYVLKCLGPDIVDEMLTGRKGIDFSTRTFFQYSVLKQLLSGGKFEKYVEYNQKYETFVKEWILQQIKQHFLENDSRLMNLVIGHQKEIFMKMKAAILAAQKAAEGKGEKDRNICHFIQNICANLRGDLVIPKDALDKVLALNNATPVAFSQSLMAIIQEMEESLSTGVHAPWNIEATLALLPFKPQNELFKGVFGCGEQCPFCKVPCEAGGTGHTEHFASVHRPQGIGRCRDRYSEKLVTNICSSCVASNMSFSNHKTEGKFHPYKDYRTLYPNWNIQPDPSIEASDYWKYVFAQFNKNFAVLFDAKPADIPAQWKSIKKEQALRSLEETFKMK